MDVFTPTKLPIPENKLVIDIAAGREHSLILIGITSFIFFNGI